jgi:peptidoglycan/LPS O-acetylase OafA/YrhL
MEALDSLRGICALLVAVFHYPLMGVVRTSAFIEHSYLFVDFFFVLSGFVIATSSERKLQDGQWRGFLLRRFLRLYPLHILTLLVFVSAAVAMGQLNSDEQHSAGAVLSNVFLLQGFGFHHSLTWNWPAWSISVEAALYVAFAILVSVRAPLVTYAGMALIGVGVLLYLGPKAAGTYDIGMFRGLAGFFIGVLLTRLPKIELGSWAEVATLGLAAAFVTFNETLPFAALAFAPAVYVLSHSDGVISKALNRPWLVSLGTWSFGIYMLHAVLIAAMRALAGPLHLRFANNELTAINPIMADLYLIPYLAGLVILARFSWVYIEKPAMGLAARFRAPQAA